MSVSQRGPVRIDVQALVHATEDEEKVKTAITNLFPEEVHTLLEFKQNKVRGHFHNPIIRLEICLDQPVQAKLVVQSIGNRLLAEDRREIAETFESRIDKKGHLFLRFDKQESYQGRLRILNQGDSLRLVIRFAGSKHT
ncbi:MAG: RNA-binding domain-containing protein, partial [Promethearchaeota archaeon]